MPGSRALRTAVVCTAVAVAAFLLYRATLLPGVDFGDSGSLQTTVGSAYPTPRDGYPLYLAIGAAVLRITGLEPARALNLTSALEAALACGLFVAAVAALTGSLPAGVAAASLFAVSYTFWSQAVTAEVYALHACFVLACVLLLLRWEERASDGRLAAFFACYAIGFGNHLSMILLAPAFTLFLFMTARHTAAGWRSMLAPRVVVMAIVFAALGAAQYVWNLRTLWFTPQPPASLAEALRTFWFDVTKSDWRDTMVLNVPQSMLRDHAAMYWFDLRQQFGVPAIALAVAGAFFLVRRSPRRAVLVLLVYAANFAFAFGYNVGDTHVFYLPAHLAVALLAGAAIAAPRRFASIAACVLASYAVLRGWQDFPALDRSDDTRPARVLDALTAGLDDRRSILLVDLNWQMANGLSYYTKVAAPQVAAVRLRDVLLYAPALIRDNLASGRQVFLTAPARNVLNGSYGPLFDARQDALIPTFDEIAGRVAPGTRYVLCIMKPTRDFAIDRSDLAAGIRRLSQEADTLLPPGDYAAIAGLAGSRPALVTASDTPFARSIRLGGVPVRIRMDGWLSADTIRRMGFGHVIAARRHALIAERGVSFVAFDSRGEPIETAYFANIFATPPRFVIE